MDLADLDGALNALNIQRHKAYIYAPLTGASIIAQPDATVIVLKPAGTIAACGVVLPSNARDGAEVTITTTQIVTTLTASCVGKTVIGPAKTINATTPMCLVYVADDGAWYQR